MIGSAGVPARVLIPIALAALACVHPVVAGDDDGWMPKPAPPVDSETSGEYWWEGEPTPWGMITASYVFSNYSDSPSPSGVRLSFGPMGVGDEYYGWAELWASFRRADDEEIASTGLSMVPISGEYRRIAFGALLDVGFERRAEPDRYVLAGIIGIGGEFVVRLFRHWDFVSTVEIDYRTTVEAETQARLAIRYHHRKLGIWFKD